MIDTATRALGQVFESFLATGGDWLFFHVDGDRIKYFVRKDMETLGEPRWISNAEYRTLLAALQRTTDAQLDEYGVQVGAGSFSYRDALFYLRIVIFLEATNDRLPEMVIRSSELAPSPSDSEIAIAVAA